MTSTIHDRDGSRDPEWGWGVHWPSRCVKRSKTRLSIFSASDSVPYFQLWSFVSPNFDLLLLFPFTQQKEWEKFVFFRCYEWNSKNEAIRYSTTGTLLRITIMVYVFVTALPFCTLQRRPTFSHRFPSSATLVTSPYEYSENGSLLPLKWVRIKLSGVEMSLVRFVVSCFWSIKMIYLCP